MKKNFLNLLKNLFKLLTVLALLYVLKKAFNVNYLANFKLFSRNVFSKTIDIDIQVGLGKLSKPNLKELLIDIKEIVSSRKTCSFIPPGLGNRNK